MNDQAVQPGVEPLAVAQRRKVAPGAEQRLLGGVLGAVRITQDPVGQGIAAVDAGRHQGRERVLVAIPGPLDELGLHLQLRLMAIRLTASPSMEPALAETFSPGVNERLPRVIAQGAARFERQFVAGRTPARVSPRGSR